ncbi:MAG: F0F1 ATP synthase subunit A [Saprospiraceae bacterium]|nr:F0F1 ATP synthase subunit A [Saprospiraceae bacterium]
MMKKNNFLIAFFLFFISQQYVLAGGGEGHEKAYDPAATAIHHISDGNVYTILDGIGVTLPLPVIVYAPDQGWDFFSSGKFHPGHHEDGHESYNGYVLHHGSIYRVIDAGFPGTGSAHIEGFEHSLEDKNGKKVDVYHVLYEGQKYRLDARSTLDGGVLGGGITSFYDFSITKNVVSMILVSLFLLWLFTTAAKSYKKNPDKAPKGIQGVVEPMFMFIRDEVAIPFIGKDKYRKFLPLLMSIFFFILGLNLFGQIPFLGSTNVTGNLTVTMIIAVIVFIIVSINGKKDYWQHIFWMPNVPVFIKPLLAAVEIMGLFIKPLTLMLRLAGNISAGHIAILSFIGLIFIFGNAGANLSGSVIGTFMAIPLTLFMMAIELIVAFVQAFVFTILTASYIGAAIEEHHHAEEHHH